MSFQSISVRDVEQYLEMPDTVLIDLRSREEYEESHFQGAVNIPYEEMAVRMTDLSKDRKYILYCERGSVSLRTAKEMSLRGYRTYSVTGGIHAWKQQYYN